MNSASPTTITTASATAFDVADHYETEAFVASDNEEMMSYFKLLEAELKNMMGYVDLKKCWKMIKKAMGY